MNFKKIVCIFSLFSLLLISVSCANINKTKEISRYSYTYLGESNSWRVEYSIEGTSAFIPQKTITSNDTAVQKTTEYDHNLQHTKTLKFKYIGDFENKSVSNNIRYEFVHNGTDGIIELDENNSFHQSEQYKGAFFKKTDTIEIIIFMNDKKDVIKLKLQD
ncbi:MAG: hypothetical protein PWQ37_1751 [Candidatus Petromonas sp.]|jgi:hypothetical protein|nr:hypothetical protein [Candidatus Petromonas sp.]